MLKKFWADHEAYARLRGRRAVSLHMRVCICKASAKFGAIVGKASFSGKLDHT